MKEGKMAEQATAAFFADPTQAKRSAPQARRPIRRSRFGAMKGRQAQRGGDELHSRSPGGKRSAQARINVPGRRRQSSGARERWKPGWGETPGVARCASTTARPHITSWPETPGIGYRCEQFNRHTEPG
jgi:hypothetical protein